MLGFKEEWLTENKAIYTASEILGQPRLWMDTWKLLFEKRYEISVFLNQAMLHEDLDIILTGAGTSAFIGSTLENYFKKYTGRYTRAVATTDIVARPSDYLYSDKPVLLISFARSGNSPESTAAVALVNQLCKKAYHLVITCNKDGQLARLFKGPDYYCLVLPPESEDKSLAMTGSYTSMLLSGILIARLQEVASLKTTVESLAAAGAHILNHFSTALNDLAHKDFSRVIFLGAGPLYGVAQEGHLKMQELTDGKIVCKFDSFLGFRHGPKAVIDHSSILIYLFSDHPYAHQYELDIIESIHKKQEGMFRLGIGKPGQGKDYVDLLIEIKGCDEIDETMLSICTVIPAQIFAFYKSIQSGLCPDEPSQSGKISRVVKGVRIYPYYSTIEARS